jgi:hypothetical protein
VFPLGLDPLRFSPASRLSVVVPLRHTNSDLVARPNLCRFDSGVMSNGVDPGSSSSSQSSVPCFYRRCCDCCHKTRIIYTSCWGGATR